MDVVFLAGVVWLWVVTALLVKGLERLGQVDKGQPA